MKKEKAFLLFIIFLLLSWNTQAIEREPDQKLLYKVIHGDSLYLHVFKPQSQVEPSAAIVFFFGGGWTGGTPKQFYQQSEYLSSRGILAICAEYRIKSKHGTTPFDCVEDGKSAVRWLRQHAQELHIDPQKIIASGGSAGGHVALCTAVIEGHENPQEDLSISSVPNALVTYNPVLDTSEKGSGSKKVKGRETEISPCHHVRENLPPTLIFHGTIDKTVPFENATRFTRLMKETGNQCELVAVENVGHGFFNGDDMRKNGNKYFNLTIYDTDVFLKKLGYLKGKPSLVRELRNVACVGDGNTKKMYPEFLQKDLGKKYEVKNFGKGAATIIEGTLAPYLETSEFKAVLKFNPDIALIMLGANDANPKWCLDPKRKTDFQGSAQDEFKNAYIKLIQKVKSKNPHLDIYILTPLPVWANKQPEDKNLLGRQEQLNTWVIPLLKEIAQEQNLPLIDVYSLMKDESQYSSDGVHLNEEGYKILAQKIAKKVK